MSKPTVLEKDEIKTVPYVVSTREQHLVAATGNTIYARGDLEGESALALQRHARRRAAASIPDDNNADRLQGHLHRQRRAWSSTGDPIDARDHRVGARDPRWRPGLPGQRSICRSTSFRTPRRARSTVRSSRSSTASTMVGPVPGRGDQPRHAATGSNRGMCWRSISDRRARDKIRSRAASACVGGFGANVQLPDWTGRDVHGLQDLRPHQLRPDHGIEVPIRAVRSRSATPEVCSGFWLKHLAGDTDVAVKMAPWTAEAEELRAWATLLRIPGLTHERVTRALQSVASAAELVRMAPRRARSCSISRSMRAAQLRAPRSDNRSMPTCSG